MVVFTEGVREIGFLNRLFDSLNLIQVTYTEGATNPLNPPAPAPKIAEIAHTEGHRRYCKRIYSAQIFLPKTNYSCK